MSIYLVKQLGCFMSINVSSICNVIVLYYVHFFTFCDKFRNRHGYGKTGMGQMKVIMWFMIIAELVIIDNDDTIWTQRISSLTHMNVQDESYEGASQQQEVLHGIGFGPKILDTIADRVVDKIVLDGGSVGAKPKYNVKEEKKQ